MNSFKELERRIGAIEQLTAADPLTLHMADGTVRQIRGTMKQFFQLVTLLDDEAESPLAGELAAIRDCAEIGGSRAQVFHLLRSLAQGPNKDEGDGPR